MPRLWLGGSPLYLADALRAVQACCLDMGVAERLDALTRGRLLHRVNFMVVFTLAGSGSRYVHVIVPSACSGREACE